MTGVVGDRCAAPTVTSAPDVAVVVCCYTDRRRADILAAIASLRAQTRTPDEVLLVVDHNPGLAEWLGAQGTGATILANREARGLTGARNTGVAASRSEIVAFLDDDAVADPDWLARLLAEYADDDVVAVGGRIDPVWTAAPPRWFPDEFGWVVGCSYRGQPPARAVVRNVIGANMSFRRSAVEAAGGFRHELGRVGTRPAGCEETELCIRAAAVTGGHVVHQPAAVVAHRVPPERGTWSYFRSRCYAEGVSKSIVAGMAGTGAALGSEWTYVRRVLPAGVLRALRDGLTGRDAAGFGRATAIVAGLATTATGYATGRLRAGSDAPVPDAGPGVWCAEIELSGTPRVRSVAAWAGQPTARILVRLHGHPLGYLTAPAAGGRPDPAEVARVARRDLAAAVAEHLVLDGPPGDGPGGGEVPLPSASDRVDRISSDVLVSVVVCTRERPADLARCLAALGRLTHPHLEIVVVDNAPVGDATRALVAEFARVDDRVRHVVEDRPGLSYARNRGLGVATGAVVAYTDDDVEVDPDWVQGLLRGFRRGADVACVTGMICTAEVTNPTEAYFDARVASWSTRMRAEVFDSAPRPDDPLHPFTVSRFGAGANVAFDRAFLVDSGGFDEALGAGSRTRGGEDIDKFVDTLLRGRGLAYEPSAVVWHRHRAEPEDLRRQMFGYGSGLTAFVAAQLGRADRRREVLRRLRPGLSRIVRTRSETARVLTSERSRPPRGAVLAEVLGQLAGPVLYLRARRDVRRARRS